ncbi:hypothetical protein UC34_06805 [Pandoraea vervacti]|uniref:DUF1302 domain-containing protein n=1 Tax=Pandoraea vervacti TaxID=656178 RepID=A0ABM5SWD7_9BURK|nr:DUF1302 family protein [Pandoraea vervacti]AJP56775.1 hypothetical protein UC34_06805 [Pandoraea vervacti]
MKAGKRKAFVGKRKCLAPIAVGVLLGASGIANAGQYFITDDTTIDYRVTATYGLGMRIAGQSDALINGPIGVNGLPAQINADDGNRNFRKWGLVNNRLSALFESNLKHRDFGFNFSADAFYDQVYRSSNSNNSPGTVNKTGPHDSFTDAASFFDGRRVRLLNAYAYGGWSLGDTRRLDVRLGNQVVAWGESLFFSGVAAAQGPADATKGNVPGAEVKDILLPVPQISAQLQLTDALSVQGYYQFKYKENEIFPVGDYFSTSDIVGPGAEFLYAAPGVTIPNGSDIRPRNAGQGGVGMHYLVTANTDLGFYWLNYHDKNPSVVFQNTPSPSYRIKYFDNIKLTGVSVSTRVGDSQVSGEVVYRQGAPVLVNTPAGATATRADSVQALASMVRTFGHSWLANEVDLAAEVGYLHVTSVDPYQMGGAGYSDLYNSRNSVAYEFLVTLKYPNVVDQWDLAVPISFAHAVAGNASLGGAFGSLNGVGDMIFSIGTNFTRLNNLELGMAVNLYLGSVNARTHPLADRSYVTMHAKYTF